MDPRCTECFRNGFLRLQQKFMLTPSQSDLFDAFFKQQTETSVSQPHAWLYHVLQKRMTEISGITDPYAEEKRISHQTAAALADEWKIKLKNQSDTFNILIKLAIAGNIMDFGALKSFNLHETIQHVLKTPLAIDRSTQLKNAITDARKILYIGDNAGEILFDKLFIELSGMRNVTFAVRGGPAINDATYADAQSCAMHEVAKVITSGFAAPSILLNYCSPEFIEEFNKADLIISKGQGNFEGLSELNDQRIFFLLIAKCDVVAEQLRVSKGAPVIYQQPIAQ